MGTRLKLLEGGDAAEAVTAAERGVGVSLQDLAQQAILCLDGSAAERMEMPQRPWGLHPKHQPSYSRHRSPLSARLGDAGLVDRVALEGRQVDPDAEPCAWRAWWRATSVA